MIKLRLEGSDNFFIQESYKVLRTNILFCGEDIKTILMTSTGANEGKTTISLHLGASLAELGKRVLVLDADMRKSVMAARESNAKSPTGLSEVLSGQAKLSDTIYNTQISGMSVMFSGQYPPNPAELLSSTRFQGLLTALRNTFDYVIIDSPPLGLVVDAAVVAPFCDGAAILIGPDVRASQARDVIEMLQKSGIRILGAIVNEYGQPNRRKRERYDYKYYGKSTKSTRKKSSDSSASKEKTTDTSTRDEPS